MVSRFTSIKINGLFGDRNEEINFPDLDDPIRILYGVNGSGKTTILKIIQNTYRWNPLRLIQLPFNSIQFNKTTRRKFEKDTTFHSLSYSKWRSFDESEILGIQEKLEELEMEDVFNYVCEKSSELYENWESTKSSLTKHERDSEKLRMMIDDPWTNGQAHHDEIKRNEYFELRRLIDEKRMKLLNHKSASQEVYVEAAYFLLRKLRDISSSSGDSMLAYNLWDDGLRLTIDPPSQRLNDESTLMCTDVELHMNKQFEYQTTLTVKKIENPRQVIHNPDKDITVEKNCGCYLKISLNHLPRLDFENKEIGDILEVLHRMNLIAPKNGYGFSELFAGENTEFIIRMPDLYDYWDGDWEKIEIAMKDYEIIRSVSKKNIYHSQLEDYFEIIDPEGNHIDVHDFLRYHLPQDLVTHSKFRDSSIVNKHFSKRNRPPHEVTDFFEYQKTKISSNTVEGVVDYIHLPKIIDISTERNSRGNVFHYTCKFVENERRIILRSMSDLLERVQDYDELDSNSMELISTRLRERGIDFDKFKLDLAENYEGKAEQKERDNATEIRDKLNQLFIYHKVLTDEEKRNSRFREQFGLGFLYMPNMIKKNRSDTETDYSFQGIDYLPIVQSIENLVTLYELENFSRLINSKFDNVNLDILEGKITSGNQNLSFYDLSSGEQQKFQIFSSIGMQICSTSSNLLITIDEPEISLHLAWQRKFLDDVIDFISELSSFRVNQNDEKNLDQVVSLIISTHSPTLLANHYHRAQKLGVDEIDE